MEQGFLVRPVAEADIAACGRVYFQAVRHGTAPHYTAEQARAWAPSDAPTEWETRLFTGVTWVAKAAGEVVGFLTMRQDGHLDLFFVHPEWRKHGVAGALYSHALDWARDMGLDCLTTDASHLARRFLEQRGWTAEAEERVERHGVELVRHRMRLDLVPGR